MAGLKTRLHKNNDLKLIQAVADPANAQRVLDEQLAKPAANVNIALVDACLQTLQPEGSKPDATPELILQKMLACYDQTEEASKETPTPRVRRSMPRLAFMFAVVLLLVCIVGGCVALAMGINPFAWQQSWDNNKLNVHMVLHPQGDVPRPAKYTQKGIGTGDAFDEQLQLLESHPPIPAPPEGYQIASLNIDIDQFETILHVRYEKIDDPDKRYIIDVNYLNPLGPDQRSVGNRGYEKDEREPDIIEVDDVSYVFFDNLSFACVYWIDEPCIISIYTNSMTREELKVVVLDTIEGG